MLRTNRQYTLNIKDTDKGKGVFAGEDIPQGAALMRVSGKHLKFDDTLKLNDRESFCVQIDRYDYVLPNPPFYDVNHSCDPNCGLNDDLELVTLRDIKADEEITWDYSTSMLERHWVMPCKCGSPACRGVVNDFDLLPSHVQQKYNGLGIVRPYILQYLKDQKVTVTQDKVFER